MFSFPYYRRSHHAMMRLYNRIHHFYGSIEKSLGPKIDEIVRQKIATLPDVSSSTALEYACGSGLLSLKLAPLFKSVTSRDASTGMLSRARMRAKEAGAGVLFREGNILAIDEEEKSYDYIFVQFALHLFPLETEKEILKKLCSVARKAVIIIDHNRKWSFPAAIVEWMEGGYYEQFIKQDFGAVARDIGCRSFEETEIEECLVLSFML
jgi:ubiquinone/menaquinone biosynthesis C-methylase UbiE